MTLVLLDGLEDRSSWATVLGSPANAAGRNGNGLSLASGSNIVRFTVPAALESDTFTLGFAIRFSTTPTANGNIILFRSDAGATSHTTIQVQPNGSYQLLRSLAGILATSATGLVVPGQWDYLEFQAKLHDTTGAVTLRRNGTVVASATNVDTKNAGTKTVYDSVDLQNGNIGATLNADDLYLKSGAGETFFGDITVATLYPNGNGNANQWVGSDGNSTDNYLLVDEVGTPDTSDHVKSSTVGQIDEYTLTDLAANGTIVGVCHQATMALAAAGSQTFQLVNRRTTDTVSPTLTATSTTYAGFHYTLATDPETSAAWTVGNVNALQTGVKVV